MVLILQHRFVVILYVGYDDFGMTVLYTECCTQPLSSCSTVTKNLVSVVSYTMTMWLLQSIFHFHSMAQHTPRPGDSVSGVSGEFFRYSNIFMKPPDDADRL